MRTTPWFGIHLRTRLFAVWQAERRRVWRETHVHAGHISLASLQEIHKKIMSIGFRDCRARIRQVDAQSTVSAAVVVQVRTDSHAGEAMA